MSYTSSVIRLVGLVVVAGSMALSGSGCAQPKLKAKPWAARPLVLREDVGPSTVEWVKDGYRLLTPDGTEGLFPASMAVTRVSVDLTMGPDGWSQPCLLSDPKNEFLRWNSALDDQMAVAEVFPISQRDLGGGEPSTRQILAAFRALHAGVGLVYAVNELSPARTEMFGMVYDASSDRPLACVHASAYSEPAEVDEQVDPFVLWTSDSRALVREKFERLVHACVRDLIRNDNPPQISAPTGWTPAGPTLPVEWPPRQFRTGR